jgi:hypothetical protein
LSNEASPQGKISLGDPKQAYFANYLPGKNQQTDSGYFRSFVKQKIGTVTAESSTYDSSGNQNKGYSDVLKAGALGRANKGNANTYNNSYTKKMPSPLADPERSKAGHKPTLTVEYSRPRLKSLQTHWSPKKTRHLNPGATTVESLQGSGKFAIMDKAKNIEITRVANRTRIDSSEQPCSDPLLTNKSPLINQAFST